jgi:hypothetical protein
LHPIQPNIPGLIEIPGDSDDDNYVEDLVFTEECAELQEEFTSDSLNKLSLLASISLFSPSISSFLTIHTRLIWMGLTLLTVAGFGRK